MRSAIDFSGWHLRGENKPAPAESILDAAAGWVSGADGSLTLCADRVAWPGMPGIVLSGIVLHGLTRLVSCCMAWYCAGWPGTPGMVLHGLALLARMSGCTALPCKQIKHKLMNICAKGGSFPNPPGPHFACSFFLLWGPLSISASLTMMDLTWQGDPWQRGSFL